MEGEQLTIQHSYFVLLCPYFTLQTRPPRPALDASSALDPQTVHLHTRRARTHTYVSCACARIDPTLWHSIPIFVRTFYPCSHAFCPKILHMPAMPCHAMSCHLASLAPVVCRSPLIRQIKLASPHGSRIEHKIHSLECERVLTAVDERRPARDGSPKLFVTGNRLVGVECPVHELFGRLIHILVRAVAILHVPRNDLGRRVLPSVLEPSATRPPIPGARRCVGLRILTQSSLPLLPRNIAAGIAFRRGMLLGPCLMAKARGSLRVVPRRCFLLASPGCCAGGQPREATRADAIGRLRFGCWLLFGKAVRHAEASPRPRRRCSLLRAGRSRSLTTPPPRSWMIAKGIPRQARQR